MKLYKPTFSTILIIIQLILSLINHFEHIEMVKELQETNPELVGLINFRITYKIFFFFVLIIGFYEILTKPSWFKTTIRVFLVCIIFVSVFSGFIPIVGFKSGIYNTAWFSAVIAIVLILIRFGKYGIEKLNIRNLNKANS